MSLLAPMPNYFEREPLQNHPPISTGLKRFCPLGRLCRQPANFASTPFHVKRYKLFIPFSLFECYANRKKKRPPKETFRITNRDCTNMEPALLPFQNSCQTIYIMSNGVFAGERTSLVFGLRFDISKFSMPSFRLTRNTHPMALHIHTWRCRATFQR